MMLNKQLLEECWAKLAAVKLADLPAIAPNHLPDFINQQAVRQNMQPGTIAANLIAPAVPVVREALHDVKHNQGFFGGLINAPLNVFRGVFGR